MLQSLQLPFEVRNDSGHPIKFLAPLPAACISSVKIEAAGQLVELIESYNKVYTAFDQLLPHSSRMTQAACALPLVNESKQCGLMKLILPEALTDATEIAAGRTLAQRHAIYGAQQEIAAREEDESD